MSDTEVFLLDGALKAIQISSIFLWKIFSTIPKNNFVSNEIQI